MQAKKINSLQMLRAVAVALVMFIHLINWVNIDDYKFTSPLRSFFYLRSWGAIGVDLFFVISGFIMTIVTPAYVTNKLWKDFLLKRAIRIAPVYYLISIVFFFILLRHNIPVEKESVLKTIIFLPIFDKDVFAIPIIHIGWSLSYEIYFYLLIAFFLNFRNNLSRNLLITILLLSIIGSLFNPHNTLLKFLTTPLLLEFALGIIAGLIYQHSGRFKRLNTKSVSIVLVVTGAVLMFASIFTGSRDINMQEVIENDNEQAMFRAIIWGIPSAVLLLGVVLLERIVNFKTPKVLIALGDASFSAYLIHIKVYQWYGKLFILSPFNGTVFILSSIIVCFGVSVVFYKLVERPLTMKINKLLSKKNVFAVMATAKESR